MTPDNVPPAARVGEGTRAEMFSDEAFAIAITVAVPKLRTPRDEPGPLLPAPARRWSICPGFAASFIHIGVVWMNDPARFDSVQNINRGGLCMDLETLSPTALVPLPACVLAEALREGTSTGQHVAVASDAPTARVVGSAGLQKAPILGRLFHKKRNFGRDLPRHAADGKSAPVIPVKTACFV